MVEKFRKKPIVIEAIQFTDDTKNRCFHWVSKNCWASTDDKGNPVLVIQTLEGDMRVSIRDWIIKGIKGEFYASKPDIFDGTYEKVI